MRRTTVLWKAFLSRFDALAPQLLGTVPASAANACMKPAGTVVIPA
jgi:hypothetical protein